MGDPLRTVSSLTIEDVLRQFLYILYGSPLRSASSHTIWGPPQTCFFAYYMGAPSDQCLRLLYGGPPGHFFPSLLYGPPLIFFFSFYTLNYPWGSLAPLPCGRPCLCIKVFISLVMSTYITL